LFSERESSGRVELTHGGNPKPPKNEVVWTWVNTLGRKLNLKTLLFVPDSIVTFE